MTKLGQYLASRSVNKSRVGRRTGLTKARLNELTLTATAHLRADELYLIALAINVNPGEMLFDLCDHLELIPEKSAASGKEEKPGTPEQLSQTEK